MGNWSLHTKRKVAADAEDLNISRAAYGQNSLVAEPTDAPPDGGYGWVVSADGQLPTTIDMR